MIFNNMNFHEQFVVDMVLPNAKWYETILYPVEIKRILKNFDKSSIIKSVILYQRSQNLK